MDSFEIMTSVVPNACSWYIGPYSSPHSLNFNHACAFGIENALPTIGQPKVEGQ